MGKIIKYTLLLVALCVVIYAGTQIVSSPTPPLPAYSSSDFSWTQEEMKRNDLPVQKISLVSKGVTYSVGEYEGSCSSAPLESEIELSKLTCWYAGGGTQLRVAYSNGKYLIEERWVQESDPEDASVPTAGSWKKVITLP